MNNAGERVRYVRRQLNMTQKRFGEIIGYKQNTIAFIESGRRSISNRLLQSMELQFKVNSKWIVTGDGEPYKDGWGIPRIDSGLCDALSPIQIICATEIAEFDEAQMKKLVKAMSCICENKDIKKLADRYPVDDFEADIIRSAANKINKVRKSC